MEGSHGQLCTRLTDGLSGNNTHGFTDGDRHTVSEVGTVTFSAYTVCRTALDNGTNLDGGNTLINDNIRITVVHHLITGYQYLTGNGVNEVLAKETAEQSFMHGLGNTLVILQVIDNDTFGSTAVLLTDDNFL